MSEEYLKQSSQLNSDRAQIAILDFGSQYRCFCALECCRRPLQRASHTAHPTTNPKPPFLPVT